MKDEAGVEGKKERGSSHGRAADAWAELDVILGDSPYTRFSLNAHRDWDDYRKRKWQAVIFTEKGKILARAYGATKDEAVALAVRAHHCIER